MTPSTRCAAHQHGRFAFALEPLHLRLARAASRGLQTAAGCRRRGQPRRASLPFPGAGGTPRTPRPGSASNSVTSAGRPRFCVCTTALASGCSTVPSDAAARSTCSLHLPSAATSVTAGGPRSCAGFVDDVRSQFFQNTPPYEHALRAALLMALTMDTGVATPRTGATTKSARAR